MNSKQMFQLETCSTSEVILAPGHEFGEIYTDQFGILCLGCFLINTNIADLEDNSHRNEDHDIYQHENLSKTLPNVVPQSSLNSQLLPPDNQILLPSSNITIECEQQSSPSDEQNNFRCNVELEASIWLEVSDLQSRYIASTVSMITFHS